MKGMTRNRGRLIVLALLVTALVVYAFDMTPLLWVLVVPLVVLVLRYFPIRAYFSRDEITASGGADADKPTCRKCGYDLHGSLAAGIHKCPECGERVSEEAIKYCGKA